MNRSTEGRRAQLIKWRAEQRKQRPEQTAAGVKEGRPGPSSAASRCGAGSGRRTLPARHQAVGADIPSPIPEAAVGADVEPPASAPRSAKRRTGARIRTPVAPTPTFCRYLRPATGVGGAESAAATAVSPAFLRLLGPMADAGAAS
ncbi:hypothetical protein KFE25_006632 [Diacronema lutheri]|uniref:Uncharacterized protein n=1 Tax=Diacronema lutheri TaxID=2081491 RepID=A0A8J5XTE4_DIALT|nr:hypothetical protein KFE25_006632 [Diacronema lutheri]